MDKTTIHILMLEDNPADAELIQFELEIAGIKFTAKVATTEKDYIHELQESCPDLILSDYDLPLYNGTLALAEAKKSCPHVPFILVTGAVTEDRAIDILTGGAKDYVMKNRLSRLVPAVRRALDEAEEIKARKTAEDDLIRETNQIKHLLTLYQRPDTQTEDIESFVIEECIRISKSHLGFFGFINEDETLMVAHLWSEKAMEGCAIDFKPVEFSLDHAGIWAEAIRKHKPLIVNNYLKPDPRKKGYPEGHVAIKRLMSIPVIREAKAVAIAAVANKEQDYDESDLLQMSLLLESTWDIFKRKQAEESLRLSEEKYRLVVENAGEGILIIQNGWVTFANRGTVELLGFSEETLTSKPATEFIHPVDRKMVIDHYLKRMKGKEVPPSYTFRMVTQNRIVKWVEMHSVAIQWKGRPATLNFLCDITEHKQAEKERETYP